MIDYSPLWKTMEEKGISQYKMIEDMVVFFIQSLLQQATFGSSYELPQRGQSPRLK